MSRTVRIGRRQFLALFLSSALSSSLARRGLAGPDDRGIGGTGVASSGENDRGIGGTGVIGTIRKFGSIVVNDMRIAYPPDAVVRIDGRPAGVADLKIGQVVRVVTADDARGLSTRAINVTSEVVGPVEKAAPGRLTVLGQSVTTAGLKRRAKVEGAKVGETVAVSGLRRNDGTIVASLVEWRPGAPSRVAGPVRLDADGALRIGGLALSGVDPALVGRRAVVEGTIEGDRLAASRATPEAALFPLEVRRLSIESYVERRGRDLALGSGFDVAIGGATMGLPEGRSVRAVVATTIGPDGRLTLDRLRVGGRTFEPGAGRHGGSEDPGGARGPGTGRTPMNFDRGPGGRDSGNHDFGSHDFGSHDFGNRDLGGGIGGGGPGGNFPGGGGLGGGFGGGLGGRR